jgi:hypothetical protein
MHVPRNKGIEGTSMATAATLTITLLNVVLVFVLSLIGGDGTDMIWILQRIGFTWLAFTCGFALFKCSKGSGRLGVLIAISSVPVGLAVALIAQSAWSMSQQVLRQQEATPKEVTEICQSAGARYLARPSTPVNSIALDWQTGLDWARLSYFNNDSSKFGRFRFLEDIKYPETIHFIEQKAGRVPPPEKQWPYKRKSIGGVFVGAAEITADVLVTYEFRKLSKADARKSFLLTEIAVSDRRNGEVLASLSYVTGDSSEWPICGETSPGEMNIAEFIFKAIGTPSN